MDMDKRIVVQITWLSPSPSGPVAMIETYGPFGSPEPAQDPMVDITRFLDAWKALHGEPINILMSIVQPPIYPTLPTE